MKKSAQLTLNEGEVAAILREHFKAKEVKFNCTTRSHGDQRDSWTSAVLKDVTVILEEKEY